MSKNISMCLKKGVKTRNDKVGLSELTESNNNIHDKP